MKTHRGESLIYYRSAPLPICEDYQYHKKLFVWVRFKRRQTNTQPHQWALAGHVHPNCSDALSLPTEAERKYFSNPGSKKLVDAAANCRKQRIDIQASPFIEGGGVTLPVGGGSVADGTELADPK